VQALGPAVPAAGPEGEVRARTAGEPKTRRLVSHGESNRYTGPFLEDRQSGQTPPVRPLPEPARHPATRRKAAQTLAFVTVGSVLRGGHGPTQDPPHPAQHHSGPGSEGRSVERNSAEISWNEPAGTGRGAWAQRADLSPVLPVTAARATVPHGVPQGFGHIPSMRSRTAAGEAFTPDLRRVSRSPSLHPMNRSPSPQASPATQTTGKRP